MDCDKVKEKFSIYVSCCDSCHEDDEEGFGDDLWFLAEDGVTYHVCCAVGRKLEGEDE